MLDMNISIASPHRLFALSPLMLALAAPSLMAQSADPEQVTIVGSRVKGRTVFDSAVPIDRFNARDVEQALAGGSDLGTALQALSPSINQPRVSASGAADSVRVVQLRGLAPDQVLVLVNGKRRHTNAVLDLEGIFQGTVPVDLNTLPNSAIERIEILRDGAGAQYGSDAVAGVINIVLKGGAQGGSASINAGAHHTRFAPTGKTLTDGQTVQLAADQGLSLGQGGFVRLGAEVLRKSGTQRAGPSDAGWTSWNGTDADMALDGQVLFKSGDPKVKSSNLFVNASLPLANGAEAYGFATYHHRNTEGAAFFRFPGDPNNVLALYPNGYRPVTTGGVADLGAAAGLRFSAGNWALDASLRQGDNGFDYGVKNSVNASLDKASPTQFHLANFKAHQTSVNLDATRSISLPGLAAPLNLAAGGEWLHEGYSTSPGDAASYAAGSNTSAPPGAQAGPGLRPVDAVKLSRNVQSLYADAEAELSRAWLLAGALRQAHYSDAGSATTGKLATRYKLDAQWLLRSSISSSFRAPALAQTGFRFATLNFNGEGTGLQNNALLPASDALAQAFGATALKPETSRNLSVGAAWRAASGASLSVDAYQVRVKDRITRTSDLQSDAVTAYLAGIGRTDIQSVAFLTNALDTTTTGLDFSASHDHRVFEGMLTLSAALNLNKTHIDHVRNTPAALAKIDPALNLLGSDMLLRVAHGTPNSKLIIGADWQRGHWGFNARATRYGTVQAYSFDDTAPLVDGAPAQRLGGTWVVDTELQYKPSVGLTLALGANNLFNRYPQRTLNGSTYGGAFPYNFADPTGINGACYYARASYRW
jgi:iron complex outermembrane receptor protein